MYNIRTCIFIYMCNMYVYYIYIYVYAVHIYNICVL